MLDKHFFIGLVKRDASDSIGEKITDVEETKYCRQDSNCLHLVQWCDKTKFKAGLNIIHSNSIKFFLVFSKFLVANTNSSKSYKS